MVSPLRDLIRRLPLQEIPDKPLPKNVVGAMLADPEYRPVPPEACECAVPVRGRIGLEWRRCTILGRLDGQLPDNHVRMNGDDFLYGFLGIRACRRPGEPRPVIEPFPGEVRGPRAAQPRMR